jgi:prevent-host-death family protein
MDNMGRWLTGDAKQQFSEVLRRSETEPQEIYRRDRLVAAVLSAEDFEQFRRWQSRRQDRTLGDAGDEIRELCARYEYELDTGERRDRDAWADEAS